QVARGTLRAQFRTNLIRKASTQPYQQKTAGNGFSIGFGVGALAGMGAIGIMYLGYASGFIAQEKSDPTIDYQEVYNAIAKLLDEDESYDDGSYAPVLLRLAWHASGTFDLASRNGGSGGATMRFKEGNYPANAGLAVARDLMERIKKQFPKVTYSDLWTLAGVVAVQEMGGPIIPWRPGRSDYKPESDHPPDGRLPDGSKDENHIRQVFSRMGFNDQETVALIGAHAMGRCHINRSGYDGPWTFSPTMFTNDYFVKLVEEKWVPRKWDGPYQFADENTKSLMMLPTDMALYKDPSYRKYVLEYAKDADKFAKDFADAFSKLLELGNRFEPQTSPISFKPTTG
ncbi:heme peroxidase, partial [Massospora cicadina]